MNKSPQGTMKRSQTGSVWLMNQSFKAGLVYFGVIFSVGFVLGTVRVLVAVPGFGEQLSVLIEIPVILTVAWLVCGWCMRKFAVPKSVLACLTMGSVAFGLLMLAEFGLATLLFGRSVSEHIASYATAQGSIGLAGQMLFAAFPLIIVTRLKQQSGR